MLAGNTYVQAPTDASYFQKKLRDKVSEEFFLGRWAVLLADMLHEEPKKRPTAAEALVGMEIIRKALENDASN